MSTRSKAACRRASKESGPAAEAAPRSGPSSRFSLCAFFFLCSVSVAARASRPRVHGRGCIRTRHFVLLVFMHQLLNGSPDGLIRDRDLRHTLSKQLPHLAEGSLLQINAELLALDNLNEDHAHGVIRDTSRTRETRVVTMGRARDGADCRTKAFFIHTKKVVIVRLIHVATMSRSGIREDRRSGRSMQTLRSHIARQLLNSSALGQISASHSKAFAQHSHLVRILRGTLLEGLDLPVEATLHVLHALPPLQIGSGTKRTRRKVKEQGDNLGFGGEGHLPTPLVGSSRVRDKRHQAERPLGPALRCRWRRGTRSRSQSSKKAGKFANLSPGAHERGERGLVRKGPEVSAQHLEKSRKVTLSLGREPPVVFAPDTAEAASNPADLVHACSGRRIIREFGPP
mmetsp:Transcript_45597/g.140928  ORF Transcript_45597/g.140928 Transcript_45597/m.140928 type:complete len:400 (-) Transcript_45597:8-1207(-)